MVPWGLPQHRQLAETSWTESVVHGFSLAAKGGNAMKQLKITALVAAAALIAVLGVPRLAVAQQDLIAVLSGIFEVPVCSSAAVGTFQATISQDNLSVAYSLTYNLEGIVTQSHIHLAQATASGGISVWLCQTATNADPTTLAPICPPAGTVTGTFTKANVIGPADHGIAAPPTGGADDTNFAELLRAMRLSLTYANVHSDICPSGEIRGQISRP
jgi:hypothetical protein